MEEAGDPALGDCVLEGVVEDEEECMKPRRTAQGGSCCWFWLGGGDCMRVVAPESWLLAGEAVIVWAVAEERTSMTSSLF